MNYPIVIVVLLAVMFLLIFVIRSDRKDMKNFADELNESELEPDKHKEDRI
ncbi:MAG TPA: hypothetical protein VLZ28_06235 [Daejeonella sp.]|nr:hypothetical protein [Daejeonella sp.]